MNMSKQLFMWMLMGIVLVWGAGVGLGLDQAKPGEEVRHEGKEGIPRIRILTETESRHAEGDGHSHVFDNEKRFNSDQKQADGTEEAGGGRERGGIDVERLRLLVVQHRDQVKILDSWARQSLLTIRNKRSLDGQEPVITMLDMAFRTEAWQSRPILYVQAIPIRQQLAGLAAEPTERERILKEGTISPAFVERREVQILLQRMAADLVMVQSVNKVQAAYDTFKSLAESFVIVPPPGTDPTHHWHHPQELLGNLPDALKKSGGEAASFPPVEGYTPQLSGSIVKAMAALIESWQEHDVQGINASIWFFSAVLPTINPPEYPSLFKQRLEWVYNKTFNGTLVALIYAAAMVLFVLWSLRRDDHNFCRRQPPPPPTDTDSDRSRQYPNRKLWGWAVGLFILALVAHAVAMAVRWYLAGRIPIQNQFESVLGSALLGCLMGLVLELRWKKGFFGMAFAFVGFLAMTACFVFPFVVGKDMGASIGQVAGILSNTIWLYIHVNVVIFSYALIGASFLLGLLYLTAKLWYWISPAAMLADETQQSLGAIDQKRRSFLEETDRINMVILQMAFWTLGLGIILGAVWADVSWGRPWGWDPKETFALVTWIVYLIVVHVRFVTPKTKGNWTAWLSVIGFFVMLFNWIGVNFFLTGLHSYA